MNNQNNKRKRKGVYLCIGLFVALALIIIAGGLVELELSKPRQPPEDIYADYQVYDYHLSVSEDAVGKEYGRYIRYVYEEIGDFFTEYEVTYRLIKEMDPKEFVYADVRWNNFLSPSGDPYVMQNPKTNAVDLISDWTVSSIVLQDSGKHKEWSASVDDLTVYDELLALRGGRTYEPFYSIVDVPDELRPFILSDTAQAKMESCFSNVLHIQVFFEESNAIYWETWIGFRAGLLYVDVGKELVEFEEDQRIAPICEDSALYRSVIAALEAYAEGE